MYISLEYNLIVRLMLIIKMNTNNENNNIYIYIYIIYIYISPGDMLTDCVQKIALKKPSGPPEGDIEEMMGKAQAEGVPTW